jgi:hypothetical protein
MNRTTARLASLAAAAMFTMAMLAGVDRLATTEPSPVLLAKVIAGKKT